MPRPNAAHSSARASHEARIRSAFSGVRASSNETIPLGAAYLAELSTRFQSDELSVAAAYNAGEDQVVLWRRYCI